MQVTDTKYFGQPAPGAPAPAERSRWAAVKRGFRMRCPACGEGRVFGKYLKVNDVCAHCGEELFHHRADDAPAYFTILIVGHVTVAGALFVEQQFMPALWIQEALWLSAIPTLSLTLLPRIKGALVGYQWAGRMHGFGGASEEPEVV